MSTNGRNSDAEYSPFDSDLPTVQIPLGRDQLGLTIEGRFVPHFELPDEARESLLEYVEGGGRPGGIGQTKVHECVDCADRDDGHEIGYLTTSDKAGSNAYNRRKYTCSNSWREESVSSNGYTAGRHAPETWDIELLINGEHSRVLGDSDEREYTLVVRLKDDRGYDADVLGETTLTLDGDETIEGETEGKPWKADVEILEETARVQWRRVDEDGEPVRYAFRDGESRLDNEPVGLLPLDDMDLDEGDSYVPGDNGITDREYTVDGETIVTRDLATTVKSLVQERECGGTKFRQVYPNGTLVDEEDLVPVHDLNGDEVPNAKSHLSRIQNQIESSVSQGEMLQTVAEACKEFWDTHGYPEWVTQK